ncbi:MAG: hypothetical protein D4R57_01620 [Verrucomicrobiales bacterium]|nr:MAG: hypothetical protein D4R57_01620 [Verrucomicrobiales bacterium]
MMLLTLTSCSQRDVLVGKWQDQKCTATLEFFADGTASYFYESEIGLHKSRISFHDKVRFEGKDRMMIGDFGFFRFKILSHDELSWTPPNSQPEVYRRVKK